jgi:hypothetical protein
MKLRTFILAIVLAFSGCSAAGKVDRHPPSGIQPLLTAIGTEDCTAFSINQKERYYLTAAHCVDESDPFNPILYLFHSRIRQFNIDRTLDLCVFKAAFGMPAFSFADTPPNSGDRVFVEGFFDESPFPTIFEGMYHSDGIVREPSVKQFVLRAIFEMQVNSGQSGSPILNQNGEVVSVAQLTIRVPSVKIEYSGGATFAEMKAFVQPYIQ